MPTDQFSVSGKSVVVTGSSKGIGRGIVERFAADGADVVVSSRDPEQIQEVADGINSTSGGGSAIAVECDVTDRSAVEGLVSETVDEFGSVDVMVNNAGASFMAPIADISPNGWKTIININLHGTFHCSQVAGEEMRANNGGIIINYASRAGLRLSPKMSHYGAAKAGIINFTKSLAHEWSSDGIRVNCVAPGLVATPGVASQMGITAGEIDREEVDRTIGVVEEIADVTQFLASPASSYINGETICPMGTPRFVESNGE